MPGWRLMLLGVISVVVGFCFSPLLDYIGQDTQLPLWDARPRFMFHGFW